MGQFFIAIWASPVVWAKLEKKVKNMGLVAKQYEEQLGLLHNGLAHANADMAR